MSTLKNLNHFISRKNKVIYFIAIMATILAAFASLIVPQYVSFFVDSILGNETSTLSDFGNNIISSIGGINYLKDNLIISGIIIIGLNLVNALFVFTRERTVIKASESSVKNLRDNLYDHVQRLPFDKINRWDTGDLIQRGIMDLETIRTFISGRAMELIRIITITIIVVVLMFRTNIKIAFFGVIALPIIAIASIVFAIKVGKLHKVYNEKESQLTTTLQENLTGVRVVRAFGKEKHELDKFQKENIELSKINRDLLKFLAYYWASTDLLCYLQIGLMIFISTIMAYNDEITIGTCILFLTYETMLVYPLRQIGRILSDFGKMQISLERIMEVFREEQEQDEGTNLNHDLRGDIVFKDVYFKFEDSNDHMLNSISFDVKKGQTVGILGSTGSGKSTLMHILLRLYDYQEGSITINGEELKNINKNYLRSNIGMVLQEPFLYSRTIKENLLMARSRVSDKEIVQATNSAMVHNVIESFDYGYETEIGERGVTLSGGQKQRISIARTLIKDSDILIFDDSLSAVDTQTDASIREELKKINKEVSIFLISQRITTLMDADKIIVLNEGVITNIGLHDDLIKIDGLYKDIWEIQSSLEDDYMKEVN